MWATTPFHHTNTWASWGRLDEIILEGKTLLPYETGFVDPPTYWTNYMMGQHNRAVSGQAYHLWKMWTCGTGASFWTWAVERPATVSPYAAQPSAQSRCARPKRAPHHRQDPCRRA